MTQMSLVRGIEYAEHIEHVQRFFALDVCVCSSCWEKITDVCAWHLKPQGCESSRIVEIGRTKCQHTLERFTDCKGLTPLLSKLFLQHGVLETGDFIQTSNAI